MYGIYFSEYFLNEVRMLLACFDLIYAYALKIRFTPPAFVAIHWSYVFTYAQLYGMYLYLLMWKHISGCIRTLSLDFLHK